MEVKPIKSELKSRLKEKIIQRTVDILFSIVFGVLTILFLWDTPVSLYRKGLSQIGVSDTVSSYAVLSYRQSVVLLILFLAFAYLLYKNFNKLIFDPKLGCYHNKKRTIFYCTNCKNPLNELDHGYYCRNKACDTFYDKPDYKKPGFDGIIYRDL